MRGTHELGSSTTRRRFAAGLVGGFAALALGAAPIMHDSATLDVDVECRGVVHDGCGAERERGEPTDQTGREPASRRRRAQFVRPPHRSRSSL